MKPSILNPTLTYEIMGKGKGGGGGGGGGVETSKKAQGQARKADAAASKKAAKDQEAQAVEAATWDKGAKSNAKAYVHHRFTHTWAQDADYVQGSSC